jgi:hypothetical protein
MVESRKAIKVLTDNLSALLEKAEEVHAGEYSPDDEALLFHQLRSRLLVVQGDVKLALPPAEHRVDDLPQETLSEFYCRCVSANFFDSYNVQHEASDPHDFAGECGGNLLIVTKSYQSSELAQWIALRRPAAVARHIARILLTPPVNRSPYPNSTTAAGLNDLYARMYAEKCGSVKKCQSGGEAILRRCAFLHEHWAELQRTIASLQGSDSRLEKLFTTRAAVKEEYDALRSYAKNLPTAIKTAAAALPMLDPARAATTAE